MSITNKSRHSSTKSNTYLPKVSQFEKNSKKGFAITFGVHRRMIADELAKQEIAPSEKVQKSIALIIAAVTMKKRKVIGYLIHCDINQPVTYAAHKHIAKVTGISISTIQRTLDYLRDHGLLTSVQPEWDSSCVYHLSSFFRLPWVSKLLKGFFPVLAFSLHLSMLASSATFIKNDRVVNEDTRRVDSFSNNRTILFSKANQRSIKIERIIYSQEQSFTSDDKKWLRREQTVSEIREWHSFHGVEPPCFVLEEDYQHRANKVLALPENTQEQVVYKKTKLTIAKVQDEAEYKRAIRDIMITKKEEQELTIRQQCSLLIPGYIKGITAVRLTCYGQIFLSLMPRLAILHALSTRDKSLAGLDAFYDIGKRAKDWCKLTATPFEHETVNKITKLITVPKNPRLVIETETAKPKTIQTQQLVTEQSRTAEQSPSEQDQIIESGRKQWNKQRSQVRAPSSTNPSYIPFKGKIREVEHVCIQYHLFEEYLNSEKASLSIKAFGRFNPHHKRYLVWLEQPGNTPQKGIEIYQKRKVQ